MEIQFFKRKKNPEELRDRFGRLSINILTSPKIATAVAKRVMVSHSLRELRPVSQDMGKMAETTRDVRGCTFKMVFYSGGG